MKVTVSFTLDIDRDGWNAFSPPITDDALAAEVQAHAENVVRDLFFDQGWTVTR